MPYYSISLHLFKFIPRYRFDKKGRRALPERRRIGSAGSTGNTMAGRGTLQSIKPAQRGGRDISRPTFGACNSE